MGNETDKLEGELLTQIMAKMAEEAKELAAVRLAPWRTASVISWRRETFAFMQSYMQVREAILKTFRDAGHLPTIRVAFPSFDLEKEEKFAQKSPLTPLILIPFAPIILLLFPLIFPWASNFNKPHIATKKKLNKIATLLAEFDS